MQAVSKYTQLLICCVVATLHLLVFKFLQPWDVRLCHRVSGSLCYSVHITPGFLSNCYICLPCSKLLATLCQHRLAMVQIKLNKFTFSGPLCQSVLDCCYMLNIPRRAENTRSLGWFVGLSGPLLSKTRHVLQ